MQQKSKNQSKISQHDTFFFLYTQEFTQEIRECYNQLTSFGVSVTLWTQLWKKLTWKYEKLSSSFYCVARRYFSYLSVACMKKKLEQTMLEYNFISRHDKLKLLFNPKFVTISLCALLEMVVERSQEKKLLLCWIFWCVCSL